MTDPRPRRRAGDSAVLAQGLDGLREPLDGILGRVSQLLAGPLAAESRTQADAIRRDAASLLERVGGIRDLVELEDGTLEIRHLPFAPVAALRAEVDRLEPFATAEGLDLSLRVEPGVPDRAVGDPSRLRQVVEELIRFAVDHTRRGSVEVRVGWTAGRLLVDVEDTGLGAEEAQIQRFLGAEASQHGLALARELVEVMGGSLRGSARSGLGGSFRIELPLDEEPGPDRPLVEADLTDTRILLLAEEAADLDEHLESVGVRTLECGSSTEALRRLRAAAEDGDPFDVVVAWPPFAGPDPGTFASLAKGDARLRHTELVMVAAGGRPGDAARLEEAGWAGYLVRPVATALLHRVLRAIVGARRAGIGLRFVTRHVLAEADLAAAPTALDAPGLPAD